MCEATAYLLKNGQEELILKDVDVIEPDGDSVRIVNIFGEQKVLKAEIHSLNLINVQPLIRYDLGDSVTVFPTPCPCGSPLPSIASRRPAGRDVVDRTRGRRVQAADPAGAGHRRGGGAGRPEVPGTAGGSAASSAPARGGPGVRPLAGLRRRPPPPPGVPCPPKALRRWRWRCRGIGRAATRRGGKMRQFFVERGG